MLAIGLLLAGGASVYRARSVLSASSPNQDAIQVGQQLVRQTIDETIKTSFGPIAETVVEALPEGKTQISGWVDLMTADGASDRQNYSIVVFRNGSGDWVG